jgi:hypothetical protein
MVASAKNLVDSPLSTTPKQKWQDEAWTYYDESPELRYGIQYLSNAMSRVNLFAATYSEDGKSIIRLPVDHPASIRLQQFGGGPGGQAQLLSRSAQNLGVAGIGFLIGEPTDDGLEDWTLYSSDDVRVHTVGTGERAVRVTQVRDSAPNPSTTATAEWRMLPDEATVVAMWRPHARHVYQPDSPVRAALSALAELDLLNERIAADAMSRLAGAGVFVVPSEATFPKSEQGETDDDDLTTTLMEAMVVPIGDRDSAAAVVPLIIRVPGEYASGIQHISFATPFDERVLDLRTQAISRLAVGLELPNEVLTGMADVNHWSAWQIEESAVKLHVEPLAELICEGVTEAVVAPLGDPEAFCWYETSELRVRPDRSENAVALYDRLELSGSSARRETGFSDEDAPDDTEVAMMLLKQLARTNPEVVPDAIRLLAPKSDVTLPAIESGGTPGPDPDPASPSTTDTPGEASGDETQVTAAALTASCEAVVMRALERAGNKLLRLHKSPKLGVPAHLIHTRLQARADSCGELLDGSFGWVDDIAVRYGADADELRLKLHGFTSNLLVEQRPLDHVELEGWVLGCVR